MLSQICLAIIAASLLVLVIVLLRLSFQAQRSIQLVQADLKGLSTETKRLLGSLNEFVHADLHTVAGDTTQLINNLNHLSSDINNKSHSLNFLFKPLSFLTSKFGSDLASDESSSQRETIPQALKWIASSAILFKVTKEFIKKYEK